MLETDPIDFAPLIIRTDSKYSIQCEPSALPVAVVHNLSQGNSGMTSWLPKWRRNDFRTVDGKPVTNQGLICYIDALLDERKQAGQTVRALLVYSITGRQASLKSTQVKFEHVYGHRGEAGNEGADRQANLGCALPAEADRDWPMLEAEVRARIAETQKALELADEEGMLEALSDDLPPMSSSPPRSEAAMSSSPPSTPEKRGPAWSERIPTTTASVVTQVSEEDLLVRSHASFSVSWLPP